MSVSNSRVKVWSGMKREVSSRPQAGLAAAFLLLLILALAGCGTAGKTGQTPQKAVQSGSAAADGKPLRIMPLGDSITDGLEEQRPGGYRILLSERLAEAGIDFEFAGSRRNGPEELADKKHEGHPGWTAEQLGSNIDRWLEAGKPDIILLHIGTNNLLHKETADEIKPQMEGLLGQIAARMPKDGKIYVAGIVPIRGLEDEVQQLNRHIETAVRVRKDARFRFVNLYDALQVSDLRDGVHPTDKGYDKMADAWLEAIQGDIRQ